MRSTHSRNTVRYYILVIALLSFLFFSNDFGLVDVQKTAIVMAVGVDREEEEFVITSQIALPKSSKQGKSSETVQLVSRGRTVAEALEAINAKTGWYPKLVFCNLVVFGRKAAEKNVFDALDFFLRDEYLTDDCLLAVCEGSAQELLSTPALVDPSSSAAISKVLSPHAERTGSVHPVNLKDFSIGYFGDAQSGLLPVVKIQSQLDEPTPPAKAQGDDSSSSESGSSESASASSGGESEKSGSKEGGEDKPVFSAQETALFVRGVWRDTLTAEETFALNAATGSLRLANFSVRVGEETCTLSVKYNDPKIKLHVNDKGRGELKIHVTLVTGVLDYSKPQEVEKIRDMGSPPDGVFLSAEHKLRASLTTAYEKARAVGCDAFGIQERLVKYKKRRFAQHKDAILNDTALSVEVQFKGVR